MDNKESVDETADLAKINWGPFSGDGKDFKRTLTNIVENAKKIANADVGVLFLTADRIFLEAAHFSPDPERAGCYPAPAAELPTYRLEWESHGRENAKKLDGLTAYVAVNREFVNLSANEVFEPSSAQREMGCSVPWWRSIEM